MSAWRYAALVSVAFIACRPPLNTFRADVSADHQLVAKTIEDIDAAAGCPWLRVDKRGVDIVSSDAELLQAGGPCEAGFYDETAARIVIPEANDYRHGIRPQVLLHELGHAVGLQHEDGTIMAAVYKGMAYGDAVDSLVNVARRNDLVVCP